MPMNATFDATQFTPRQAGDAHPPGKFNAQVTDTAIAPTKSNDGGMFNVTFTTPAGTIVNRYQLWNQNPKTVEIAQNELSALCHATGVHRLDFQNDGAALRGSRCMIEVAPQMTKNEKGELIPNGYVEVKKVYDSAGNEPGKQPVVQQQPAPQAQPVQQQPSPQAWGSNPAPATLGGAAPVQPTWGTTSQAAPAANPPWGNR